MRRTAIGGVLAAGAFWWLNISNPVEEAFDDLARGPLYVTTEFELEEIEPQRDGPDHRVGIIAASYDGPDDFDTLEITVFETESAAEEDWTRRLGEAGPFRTQSPRIYEGQICTRRRRAISCSVRMYEAVIVGAAAGPDREQVMRNITGLLKTGVKNWLEARGLSLP